MIAPFFSAALPTAISEMGMILSGSFNKCIKSLMRCDRGKIPSQTAPNPRAWAAKSIFSVAAAQFNARILLAQLDNSLGLTYKKYEE